MTSISLPELVLQPHPSDPKARTYAGGETTTLYFINDLPAGSTAEIFRIDDQGTRTRQVTVVERGEVKYLETTTYPGQPWEVILSHQGETIKLIYYSAPDPSCVVLNTDSMFLNRYLLGLHASSVRNVCSKEGGASTRIKFENRLQVKIKIFWVDSAGERVPYGTIHPGGSSIQPTYVEHVWDVATEHERLPFAVFYAAPHGGIARIESSLLSGQSVSG